MGSLNFLQPGLNDRVLGLNQGKALGGSSALNAQAIVPPFKGVVDSWEALGDPKWNWINLREYFSKAYSSPAIAQDDKEALAIEDWPGLREAKGPIQTSFRDKTPYSQGMGRVLSQQWAIQRRGSLHAQFCGLL